MSTPESKENIQIGFFIRKSTLEKVNMLTKKRVFHAIGCCRIYVMSESMN